MALRLVTGEAGSGKSARCLEALRASLSGTGRDVRLLVPTATMAEHVRNGLAREGFVFSAERVATLAKFLEPYTRGVRQISAAALRILIGELLERRAYPEFRRVARYRGFRASLAALIEETSTAWCMPGHLREIAGDEHPELREFAALYQDVEREVGARGLVLRSGLLEAATAEIRRNGIRPEALALDGFFSFGKRELELVGAMAAATGSLMVTLPRWPGAESSRQGLLALGFVEEVRPSGTFPPPRVVLLRSATLDQEAEEIARRILEEVSRGGRSFGDIGIVLRGAGPHLDALGAALERFRIPARFYFTQTVGSHPAAGFFSAAVRAMLGGWRIEDVLAAVRMNASGLGGTPAGDALDFALRERLPGAGLAALRDLLPPHVLAAFEAMEPWRTGTQPARVWARRLGHELAARFPVGPVAPATLSSAEMWRAHAAALRAFREALEETAAALGPDRAFGCAEFWAAAVEVLEDSELRVNDHRRNVVHVMDAYEARQWRLPVVFVAGLLERQFPRYHPKDPILPDAAREALGRFSIDLRTTADRRLEERFLFDLATQRASELLALSYPRFNAKGEENLPSFFLRGCGAVEEPVRRARPRPGREPAPPRPPAIHAPDLLEHIAARHTRLGPTSIEKFLACPFRFFADKTLKLEPPPVSPAKRLDSLLCGSIVHAVLEELERGPAQPLEEVFARHFEKRCREQRVPPGFRTESLRLDMLRDLEALLPRLPRLEGWRSSGQRNFEMPLGGDFAILGQMDRCDVEPATNRALVIDYKYSAHARDYRTGSEEGTRVQAGLYLLAARHLGLEPAGMLFLAFRKGVHIDGWHVSLPGLERSGAASVTREELAGLIAAARQRTEDAIAEVRAGRIEPGPAGGNDCRYCQAAEVCRKEAALPRVAAGGGP